MAITVWVLSSTTMSTKKLSNGTLSLRFMQNAQRSQNLKLVELTKAEVKDAEEWAVPQEIQDSWRKSTTSSVRLSFHFLDLTFKFEEIASPMKALTFPSSLNLTLLNPLRRQN